MTKTTLIALLGGQPQVVTFALDSLLEQEEPIQELFLIHLSPQNPSVRDSLTSLAPKFVNDQYRGKRCRFRPIQIKQSSDPLYDIQSDFDAEVASQTIRSLIAELKDQNHRLHIAVSGGRRLLGMLCVSAAMLLCDESDRIWHMYTPDAFQKRAKDGAIMHAQPEDGVQLIRVPLIPWAAHFPALRTLVQAAEQPSPSQLVAEQFGWLNSANDDRCKEVYEASTRREREVLSAFANGKNPQEVADTLHITLGTVNTHKTKVLAVCRNIWGLEEDVRLNYHFLRERFALFIQQSPNQPA